MELWKTMGGVNGEMKALIGALKAMYELIVDHCQMPQWSVDGF